MAKRPLKPKPKVRKATPRGVKPEPIIRERLTVKLPVQVIEQIRDVAYWERIPLAQLIEKGIKSVVTNAVRQRGSKYPARRSELRTGRPFKTD
jgi:hypothetical protein